MFVDCDIRQNMWKGSILMFTREDTEAPQLTFNQDDLDTKGGELCRMNGFVCTRWYVSVPQLECDSRKIKYSILHEEWKANHFWYVPGIQEAWRLAFWSCAQLHHASGYTGYAEKYGGTVGMYTDLLHKHHDHQYHFQMGLGDAIYLDCVWEHTDSLDKWTRIPSRLQRETMPVPEGMEEEVDRWIFMAYLYHFSEPAISSTLARIPYTMLSGDHDVVDGSGSYPKDLETCPVMIAYKSLAYKYYLLFQLHVGFDEMDICAGKCRQTAEKKFPYIGQQGYSFVKSLGTKVRLMGIDTRLERTRDQIVCRETYEKLFQTLQQNHDESGEKPQHLLVILEIPIIIPDLRKIEKVFDWLSWLRRTNTITKLFRPFATFKRIGFPFSEPVLLTDMVDHWNSTYHEQERHYLLKQLQKYSAKNDVRVTFVSGDVHVAGVGKFRTPSASHDPWRRHYENQMMLPFDYATDTKLMYQVITSPIGNIPPAEWIVKIYHILDKSETIHDDEMGDTDARMVRFFERGPSGKVFGKKSKKLMARRNWCSMEYMDSDDSLFTNIYMELFMGAGRTVNYNLTIPALDPSSLQ